MIEEEEYWSLIDLWILPENHEAIAANLVGENAWWFACFAVDLYMKYGEDAPAQFCEILMRFDKDKNDTPI